MKQSAKQILNNLSPFIIHSIAIFVYVALAMSEFVPFAVSASCGVAVYAILSILYGYFTDFSQCKYGLIAYAIMLVISPVLTAIESLYQLAGFGNIFFSTLHPFEAPNFVPQFVFGMIVALLPLAIGFGLRRTTNSRIFKVA